jgi:hypothetical protein
MGIGELVQPAEKGDLIYAVQTRSKVRRAKLGGDTGAHCFTTALEKVKVFHLRFQRTLPSFVSSRIIPRSESSLRIRSDSGKSRR